MANPRIDQTRCGLHGRTGMKAYLFWIFAIIATCLLGGAAFTLFTHPRDFYAEFVAGFLFVVLAMKCR